MKIFYTASYFGKEKYQSYYDLVLNALRDHDIEIISPEIGNYRQILKTKDIDRLKDEKSIHYEAVRRGIMMCDAVIIEVSHEDFQLGHEATLAALNNKPVLCLSIYEDFSEKINSKYFFGAKYSKYSIGGIVSKFLDRVDRDLLNQRFNMFLSPNQVQYLEDCARVNRMNKSEYVRKLIDEDMRGSLLS
jgi:hypothetical protein